MTAPYAPPTPRRPAGLSVESMLAAIKAEDDRRAAVAAQLADRRTARLAAGQLAAAA